MGISRVVVVDELGVSMVMGGEDVRVNEGCE
jgi:hypothetical protein